MATEELEENGDLVPQKRERLPADLRAFEDYIAWLAMPPELRDPKTKGDFAAKYSTTTQTLQNWQKRNDFWPAVQSKVKEWAKEQTPDVIQAVFKKIKRTGNAHEARLWMEWVEEWEAKVSAGNKPTVSVNIFGGKAYDDFTAQYHDMKEKGPDQA